MSGLIIIPIGYYSPRNSQIYMMTLCYDNAGKDIITIVNNSLTKYQMNAALWGMAETAAFLFTSRSTR